MLVLFETAAGYGIFKLLKEKKLQQAENLYLDFESPEAASKILKLKHFQKFQDTTEALASVTASVEGKMSKTLKKMLKKLVVGEMQEQLAVADAKLGNTIKDKLDLQCVSNSAVQELMRCIRSQADSLITGLPQKDLAAMSLGLAHSLSRYKLKFSPDKVDTMIVQAISLLDDLDKELNNYSMRAREWYGWHFPELGKIVSDNIVFARVVMAMGERTNAATCDLSSVLPEDLEQEVKEAAEISMGTEVSEGDILNISHLCEQVVEISDYRATLYDYLKNRMLAIAPNLTILVGELVGARLIAHSGSLMNLAKHPSSTVQVLGAEKALFRALKSKNDTPKYGLIYHANLVSQSTIKMKGKVSRTLAAKSSLAARVDALGEGDADTHFGLEHRAKLEARIRHLEEGTLRRISGSGKQKATWDKYENKSEVKAYDPSFDSTLSSVSKKRKMSESVADTSQTETPPGKKKKKKVKTEPETESQPEPEVEVKVEDTEETPKKKKKKKKSSEADVTMDTTLDTTQETPGPSSEKKKKKKKKSKDE